MTPFPREDYRLLSPYDPGREAVDVDLSDNTNLWGPPPAALDGVRRAPPYLLSRYPSAYGSDLKEAIGARFGVPAANVATGCGSDDLLDSVFRASTNPPGLLRFLAPTFSMVAAFARMNGLTAEPVPWKEAGEDPTRFLQNGPDLLYICRPNNPTGVSVEREWLRDLLALVGAEGPLVILDEAYADFAEDSLVEEAPASDRLLVLRTLSTLYGMAGLRVGFAVGSKALVREVEKSRGPYKVSHLAERASLAAMTDGSGWIDRIRGEVIMNRDRLARAVEARGLRPLPSQANFLLIPTEPASADEVNRALRSHGVAGRPFSNLPGIGDAIRVTVGPWPLMERFLQALDHLFEPPPPRGSR